MSLAVVVLGRSVALLGCARISAPSPRYWCCVVPCNAGVGANLGTSRGQCISVGCDNDRIASSSRCCPPMLSLYECSQAAPQVVRRLMTRGFGFGHGKRDAAVRRCGGCVRLLVVYLRLVQMLCDPRRRGRASEYRGRKSSGGDS